MFKKTMVAIEFDGVLHSAESGWQGADVIPDLPVPGAMQFLRRLVEDVRFEVFIHSSRCAESVGVVAVREWIDTHFLKAFEADFDAGVEFDGNNSGVNRVEKPDASCLNRIAWCRNRMRLVATTPPAAVILAGNAIQFNGAWPCLQELAEFKMWSNRSTVERKILIADILTETLGWEFMLNRVESGYDSYWNVLLSDSSLAFRVLECVLPDDRDMAACVVIALKRVWQETKKASEMKLSKGQMETSKNLPFRPDR